MHGRGGCLAYIEALLISFLIHCHAALALSWRGRTGFQLTKGERPVLEQSHSASQILQAGFQLSNSYDIALNELQELESEPLCHRIAARLLVNNCQLLEGKDEATVLTDSGRKIRDFVDSYAASLAICDLERGRFVIPTECIKFQEATLTQLPVQNNAYLHVSSAEIDSCLSGLGSSDSAWNTWVSYRHKALRFCEAARADNEKAQNILLFQRLTKIMSRLADDVDVEIEQRMNVMNLRAQAAGEKMESLSPLLEKLQHDLENVDLMLSTRLVRGIKESQNQVNSGLESALNLEKMLQFMLKHVTEHHAEVTAVHEQSLQTMHQRAALEADIIVGTMAAAVAAASVLQTQIDASRIQAADLESRQDNLEQSMQRLVMASDNLARNQDAQINDLNRAQNMTNEILDTLGATAASVATVGDLFQNRRYLTAWWPYIWCPVVSLVMGSYGLPPSLPRNLGLVALGETVGFMIASFPSTFASFNIIHKPTVNLLGSFIRPSNLNEVSHNSTNLTSQLDLI